MGNTLGNKGAVAISMRIGKTKFAFANAHLAAHQNAVKQRNNDYSKISKEMPLLLLKSEMKTKARLDFRINKANNLSIAATRSKRSNSNAAGDNPNSSIVSASHSQPYEDSSPRRDIEGLDVPAFVPDLDEFADRVVFMGDLNYRVRGNRCVTMRLDAILRLLIEYACLTVRFFLPREKAKRLSETNGLYFRQKYHIDINEEAAEVQYLYPFHLHLHLRLYPHPHIVLSLCANRSVVSKLLAMDMHEVMLGNDQLM